LLLAAGFAAAATTRTSAPQDQIEVLGHFPLSGQPVVRLMPARHYDRQLLYAEVQNEKTLTVIDVTQASAPVQAAYVPSFPNGKSEDILMATGTAALAASRGGVPVAGVPQTVRIMDFADPAHPTVAREFYGVTAIASDRPRGLIFLANSDGIWILGQRPALDPAVMKAYSDQVLYDR